jgi:hypothetical protein
MAIFGSESVRTARLLRRTVGSPSRCVASSASCETLEQRAMFVADPITSNHPLWTAMDLGRVRVDGVISEREWAGAQTIVRTQAYDANSRVTLRMKHTAKGLVIAADVLDDRLWADGDGGGAGNRWEFWNDDAIALFFDPKNSRKNALPITGRMFAINIGGMLSPASGAGAVGRWEFLKGDGKGTGTPVNLDATLMPGTKWKVKLKGTLNNNADVDTGWSVEILLPWSAFGYASRPANGSYMGMNFEVMFDDDGGLRTPVYSGQDPNPVVRQGELQTDDYLNGVFGSQNMTNTGWKGPSNYAYLQFVNRATADHPVAIANLTADSVTGYGARLNFTAPAGSLAGRGNVSGYEIRYSLSPIASEDDWNAAAVVTNTFTPHLRGLGESLRIGELSPSTTYYFAVRGEDSVGRLGDIASTTFTTQSIAEDPSGGGRVMVSPNGNTLMFENGEPFVMIGGTIGASNLYVRSLYTGLIYRPGDGAFVNFSNGVREGDAAGWFDAVSEYGLNTLRVQMEWTKLEQAGRTQLPSGMRWLEWREPGDSQSTFNLDMRNFLWGMMEQAARTGVRLFLQTFNNFNYRSNFELTPYSTQNGGPLSDMNDFYWNAGVLDMVKTRMHVLADWVRESPYAYTVIGFELLNEWDGHDTTRDITTELRQRSKFHAQVAADLHAYAPEIAVMSSSINLAPRGPVGRVLYYSDAFDILDPHFYTSTVAEPIYNPDSDKSVRPAVSYGGLAAYWLTNRRDTRPVHNGEWDIEPRTWPGGEVYYNDYPDISTPSEQYPFYLSEDEAIFRTVNWVSIASGLAGGGLRIGRTAMVDTWPADPTPDTTGYLPLPLSLGMRRIQKSVAHFVDDTTLGFDWANFRGTTLSGLIGATGTNGDRLLAWGSADADQGLAYVLRDAAKSTGNAAVTGASMQIKGLRAGAIYDMEFWSTGPNNGVIGTLSGVTGGANTTFAMPDFTTDVMIKFRRVA